MMKIRLIILSLLMVITTSIEAKWHNLKRLNSYTKDSDFVLKKGIEYIEIRSYAVDKHNNPKTKSYDVLFKIYNRPLSSFDKRVRKSFKRAKPIKLSGSDLRLENNSMGCRVLYNAFVIDHKNQIYKMNMVDDILSFLGKIDTDGEFQFMLWLRDHTQNIIKYRKTSKGFDGIMLDQPNMGEGKCIDTKYIVTFDKRVRVIKRRVISKKKSNRDCLMCILYEPRSCELE